MNTFYFVFLILVNFSTSSKNIHNSSLYKENNYSYYPGIPLNTNYEIDYRNTYNLRFDPKSIRRNAQFFSNNFEDLHNYDDNENDSTTITNNEISDNDQINSTTLLYKNFSKIEKSPAINLSTNIMKPQKSHNTLSEVGTRLKNLIFGTARTLLKAPSRNKGFLNLFDIIKFENAPCTAPYGGVRVLNGTCYHRLECESFGGIAIGICASGYGVCCVFKFGCGRSTNQAISYFESPRFPTAITEPITCMFTLNLLSNVRQIRIDFLFFELKSPMEGDCTDDQFIVSGQDINFYVPMLCGINTGQHIYVNVENSVQRKLFLSVFGRTTDRRAFSLRITQLRNDYAPNGCLQYYTESYGIIKSFNYDETGNIIRSNTGSYFNNLNYAICIRRASGMCTITYSNVLNGEEFDFEIVNTDSEELSFIPVRQAGADMFNCPNDFVTIDSTRLCGEKFNDGSITEDMSVNAPVTDYGNGPIIVSFRTDNETVGRGFKLIYYQENC